jgi:hypothetical protein
VDGNVYARAEAAHAGQPLVVWSPAATDSCLAPLASLDGFRAAAPAFEPHGRQIDRAPTSIFKGPDLGRYELLRELPGATTPPAALPADVRTALGWGEKDGSTPGAYQIRH